jgi:hypothetical protein
LRQVARHRAGGGLVIAATIVTPTKVLVTADAASWVNVKRSAGCLQVGSPFGEQVPARMRVFRG